MRDPARRIELFERLDPLAMDRRIEQRRKPHRASDMRTLSHHLPQPLVRDYAQLNRAGTHQRMVELLERKTMQIDEVARHMEADDETALLCFDGAEHEAFDQQLALLDRLAAFDQSDAVAVLFDLFDHILDTDQIVVAELFPETAGKKLSGKGKRHFGLSAHPRSWRD